MLAEYDDYSELHGPCADYQPGEDDLQAFDFIRQFRLDMLEQSYPGVKRVRGSNNMQTAYRLKADANLQLATRSALIHSTLVRTDRYSHRPVCSLKIMTILWEGEEGWQWEGGKHMTNQT